MNDDDQRLRQAFRGIVDRLERKAESERLESAIAATLTLLVSTRIKSKTDELISLESAARLLGYTPSGLRKIVRRTKQGKPGATIQFVQVGKGPIRFKREWLDEFVEANSVAPPQRPPTPNPRAAARKSQSIASNDPGQLAEYFP